MCWSSAGVKESSAGLFLYLLMTIRFLMDLSWVWYEIEELDIAFSIGYLYKIM